MAYWKSNFPMINTLKLLGEVDANHDGKITVEEWCSFWEALYLDNYNKDMILAEVY